MVRAGFFDDTAELPAVQYLHDVFSRLRIHRNPLRLVDAVGPGVISRQHQQRILELVIEGLQVAQASPNVRLRIATVAHAEIGRRARHQLHDPKGSGLGRTLTGAEIAFSPCNRLGQIGVEAFVPRD